MKSNEYISTPEAIWKLFKIRLSEHKKFKDLVYSYVRNRSKTNFKGFLQTKEIQQQNAGAKPKKDLYIHTSSLTKFYNAIILQGFILDTTKVKEIFLKPDKRKEAADLLNIILAKRQSILGIVLQNNNVNAFLNLMNSSASLEENRLPNPFTELPQISLSSLSSVIQQLLAQSAVLTHGESMMLHFFNNDIESANIASLEIENTNPILNKYKSLIQKNYNEAKEFDNLLDNLLK